MLCMSQINCLDIESYAFMSWRHTDSCIWNMLTQNLPRARFKHVVLVWIEINGVTQEFHMHVHESARTCSLHLPPSLLLF